MAMSPGETLLGNSPFTRPRPRPRSTAISSATHSATSRSRPLTTPPKAAACNGRSPKQGSASGADVNSRKSRLSCPETSAHLKNSFFPPKACSTPTVSILKQRRRASSEVALLTPNGSLHALSPVRSDEFKKPRLSFDKKHTLARYHEGVKINGVQVNGKQVVHRDCQVVMEDIMTKVLLNKFASDPKLNGHQKAKVSLIRLEEESRPTATTVRRAYRQRTGSDLGWSDLRPKAKPNANPIPSSVTRSENGLNVATACIRLHNCVSPSGGGAMRHAHQAQQKLLRCYREQSTKHTESTRPYRYTASPSKVDLVERYEAMYKLPMPDVLKGLNAKRRSSVDQKSRTSSKKARSSAHNRFRTFLKSQGDIESPRSQERPRSQTNTVHRDTHKLSGTNSCSAATPPAQFSASPSWTRPAPRFRKKTAVGLPGETCIQRGGVVMARPRARVTSKGKSPGRRPSASSRNNNGSRKNTKRKISQAFSRLPPIPQNEAKYWAKFGLKHVAVSITRLPL
ncbi:hypothetical protein BIW11_07599 [Tropilaelaps mercedesae]|uniref:Uncharacterized protein n=1 Tax=Tropilaelaps mercedesae TaxID=418985 RepID=A0A1V9XT99_9ACAR|nr:hypothetical protein BIW11_07599 [Tropilaelaps mercedesae]